MQTHNAERISQRRKKTTEKEKTKSKWWDKERKLQNHANEQNRK